MQTLPDSVLYELNKLSSTVDQLLAANSSSTDTLVPSNIKIDLKFDAIGTNPDNKILNEKHNINKGIPRRIIKPQTGLFYGGTMVVVHSNRQLVYKKDYIFGLTSFPSDNYDLCKLNIFDYVLLLDDHIDEITISYHAVGGDITKETANIIRSIDRSINKLTAQGNSISFTKKKTKPLADSISRIRELESSTNKLNQVKLHVKSEEEGLQWFTIGEFGNDGDTNGLFGLNISSTLNNCGYSLNIGITLTGKPKLSAVVVNSLLDKKFDINNYNTLPYINNTVVKLRLVWNSNIKKSSDRSLSNFSGALLQIGLINPVGVIDTLLLQNTSYSDKLKLDDDKEIITASSNKKTHLPSGEVWIKDNSNSHYIETNICPKNGYVVWAGEAALNDMLNGSVELHTDIQSILPNLTSVSWIEFVIYDRLTKTNIFNGNNHSSAENIMSGAVLFYPEDMCILNYILSYSNNTTLLTVGAILGQHSINNDRFDLKQIVFKF